MTKCYERGQREGLFCPLLQLLETMLTQRCLCVSSYPESFIYIIQSTFMKDLLLLAPAYIRGTRHREVK